MSKAARIEEPSEVMDQKFPDVPENLVIHKRDVPPINELKLPPKQDEMSDSVEQKLCLNDGHLVNPEEPDESVEYCNKTEVPCPDDDDVVLDLSLKPRKHEIKDSDVMDDSHMSVTSSNTTLQPGLGPSVPDLPRLDLSLLTVQAANFATKKKKAGRTIHCCEFCSYQSDRRTNLKRHQQLHTGKRKMFECRKCKAEFTSASYLATHVESVHNDSRPYTCPTDGCSARFTQPCYLRKHVRQVHLGERRFFCEFCGSRFTQKGNLRTHVRRIHMQEHSAASQKCYNCGACESTFTLAVHLQAHMRTVHQGYRPFACDQCPRRFATSSDLRKHVNSVHLGLRPFECSFCNQKFANSTGRSRHVKICHLGVRPFTCPHCEQTFVKKGTMTNHLKKVHSGEESTPSTTVAALALPPPVLKIPVVSRTLLERSLTGETPNTSEATVSSSSNDVTSDDVSSTVKD